MTYFELKSYIFNTKRWSWTELLPYLAYRRTNNKLLRLNKTRLYICEACSNWKSNRRRFTLQSAAYKTPLFPANPHFIAAFHEIKKRDHVLLRLRRSSAWGQKDLKHSLYGPQLDLTFCVNSSIWLVFSEDSCHYVWEVQTHGRTTLKKEPSVAANMINL